MSVSISVREWLVVTVVHHPLLHFPLPVTVPASPLAFSHLGCCRGSVVRALAQQIALWFIIGMSLNPSWLQQKIYFVFHVCLILTTTTQSVEHRRIALLYQELKDQLLPHFMGLTLPVNSSPILFVCSCMLLVLPLDWNTASFGFQLLVKLQIHEPAALREWRRAAQPRSSGAVEKQDWAGHPWNIWADWNGTSVGSMFC